MVKPRFDELLLPPPQTPEERELYRLLARHAQGAAAQLIAFAKTLEKLLQHS